jgi:dephospho-CoA kinase
MWDLYLRRSLVLLLAVCLDVDDADIEDGAAEPADTTDPLAVMVSDMIRQVPKASVEVVAKRGAAIRLAQYRQVVTAAAPALDRALSIAVRDQFGVEVGELEHLAQTRTGAAQRDLFVVLACDFERRRRRGQSTTIGRAADHVRLATIAPAASKRTIIGLTGGIGVGKTTVAAELEKLGAHIIDVDAVCRDAIEPGAKAHPAVLERFGPSIVKDGRIDRQVLAKRVFADPTALADLVAASHPVANEMMASAIGDLPADVPVVLDNAVLTEYRTLGRWGREGREGYGKVLLVTAPDEDREVRLVHQRAMAPADIRARMAAQADDEARREIADVEIINDSDKETLVTRVAQAWREIRG